MIPQLQERIAKNFSVIKRNCGHWDICTVEGRAFRIRGTPGNFAVLDERERPYPSTEGFQTVTSAMTFVAETLMFEQIVVDPESPGNNKPLGA